jgi:curved DNA-binding protein CbpA
MKTLYDLLGARPDDDADTLRVAFRKAAKANHPDLHAGDPYAAMRFRQIAQAYEILRDVERRATYDRLLRFKRERLRWNLRRTVSHLMRSIIADVVTAAGLAVILAGGYMIFAHLSKTPGEQLVGAAARGSPRIAAVQPAPTSANKSDDRRDRPARPAEPTTGGAAPKAAGLNSDAAKTANAFAIIVDQAGPESAAEHPDQGVGTELLDQDNAQSVKALSSSEERDNGLGKPSAADFATSDDKRDMKRRDSHDINTSDVKISDTKPPEAKMPGRARMAAKRQATNHANVEQASLETKNGCSGSQSCSRDVPPLFGVGF